MVSTTRLAPVSMSTVGDLMSELESPHASALSIGAVVEADAGLTARVLGVANSAQFGLSRKVTDISHAVSLVGMNMVRTLAIAGATSLLDSRSGFPQAREHALAVASCCRIIAGNLGQSRGDAFSAGLLHDIGELMLWQERPNEYPAIWKTFTDGEHQLLVERDLYEIDHAETGAEHLFEWRLPEHIVDAVGDHHDPHATSSLLTVIVAAADEMVDGCPRARALQLLDIDEKEAERILVAAAEEHEMFRAMLVG